MRRSVSAKDFMMASSLSSKLPSEYPHEAREEIGPCLVCEKYEVRNDEIVAALSGTSFGKWRHVEPLEDPNLFLKFSRLYRERDFAQAALSFASQYGLPCSTDGEVADSWPRLIRLSLQRFFEESQRAWVVVSLYESVLNRDQDAARSLLTNYRHLDYSFRLNYEQLGGESPARERQFTPLQCALAASVSVVNSIVKRYCEANLVVTMDESPEIDASAVKRLWYFDNVLGAMYLQMYWLLTSGGNLVRCEYCGRIISLARPHPGGRKRRRDRRFCDDACRQAHHRSKKRA